MPESIHFEPKHRILTPPPNDPTAGNVPTDTPDFNLNDHETHGPHGSHGPHAIPGIVRGVSYAQGICIMMRLGSGIGRTEIIPRCLHFAALILRVEIQTKVLYFRDFTKIMVSLYVTKYRFSEENQKWSLPSSGLRDMSAKSV